MHDWSLLECVLKICSWNNLVKEIVTFIILFSGNLLSAEYFNAIHSFLIFILLHVTHSILHVVIIRVGNSMDPAKMVLSEPSDLEPHYTGGKPRNYHEIVLT